MAGEAAAARLRSLSFDAKFQHRNDPVRDAKIAKDLITARDRLTAKERARIVGALAEHTPWTLLRAARKPLDPAVHREIVKHMRKRHDLVSQFFVTAAKRDVAAEAAELLFQLDQAASFPELAKRLKKIEASDDVVGAVNATLKKKASPDWLDDIIPLYGLIGVLVKEDVITTVAKVAKAMGHLDEDWASSRTKNIIELLERFGTGAAAEALAARLAGVEAENTAKRESVALAKRLGLPFADKPTWHAKLWLAKGEPNEWFGAFQKGPQVMLSLGPQDMPDWKVELRGAKKGIYCNWAGDVTQDDFRLPPLSKLEDFPDWLGAAGRKLKVSFSVEQAVINCGRYKKAAGTLRAWLGG